MGDQRASTEALPEGAGGEDEESETARRVGVDSDGCMERDGMLGKKYCDKILMRNKRRKIGIILNVSI